MNIDHLRSDLLDLHKKLLEYQGRLAEKEFGRSIPPYEMWHLSTSDKTFNWLRSLSEIIVQIDEKLETQEAGNYFEDWVKGELLNLTDVRHEGEFQKKLFAAITQAPELQFELSKLRSHL